MDTQDKIELRTSVRDTNRGRFDFSCSYGHNIVCDNDLSIQDIHCLDLELQEELEMDVGKLVRGMGMKKMKSEGSIQHEAVVEECELQQEIGQ